MVKEIRKGSCVRTKVGDGRVKRIDRTYSIPLHIIKLTKGKNKGEEVALTESQLKRINKC